MLGLRLSTLLPIQARSRSYSKGGGGGGTGSVILTNLRGLMKTHSLVYTSCNDELGFGRLVPERFRSPGLGCEVVGSKMAIVRSLLRKYLELSRSLT